jgi:hypothetical protein
VNTYLRICVSAYLRDKKITKTPSENSVQHLKKKVPAGSNAYLRTAAYFLKKSQPYLRNR